jgi:ABC-2 type transport system permease protein
VLSPAELLARTALVVGYLALCMLALGAVGLFFSTLTDSPLAAALGVLALVVASAALQPLDAAAALEPYLPTTHWLAWIDLYRDPILWPAVREGAAVQAGTCWSRSERRGRTSRPRTSRAEPRLILGSWRS